MITQEILKSKLTYNKYTGKFTWKHSGKEAGFPVANGRYWGIGINNKTYRRARLAWLYVYGQFPKQYADHINGDKMDDRIENIRDISVRENNSNLTRHRNGYLVGTTYHKNRKSNKKWVARCKTKGITKFLGYYKTQEEAHEAYKSYINTENR